MTARFHPVSVSVFLHLAILSAAGLGTIQWNWLTKKRNIEIEVIQYPVAANANLQVNRPPLEAKAKPPPQKAVFGVSRKAITATTSSDNAAEVKLGNTVAKAQDNLTLEKDDADSIPIPTDDYLVSSMPRLKAEVRIPYPDAAKIAGVEGPVVMDILIDSLGKVRQVELIQGPGYGLNEAAVAAVRGFEFVPAKVGADPVAVKIRYTYRFILENR